MGNPETLQGRRDSVLEPQLIPEKPARIPAHFVGLRSGALQPGPYRFIRKLCMIYDQGTIDVTGFDGSIPPDVHFYHQSAPLYPLIKTGLVKGEHGGEHWEYMSPRIDTGSIRCRMSIQCTILTHEAVHVCNSHQHSPHGSGRSCLFCAADFHVLYLVQVP